MTSSQFAEAREIFGKIKESICDDPYNAKYKQDFRDLVSDLIKRFDTAIHENRFTVGGAVEYFFCAFLNAIGIQCKINSGPRVDLKIEGVDFSIKSVFACSGLQTRLVNFQGDGNENMWNEPTIFIVRKIGILYTDPELLNGQDGVVYKKSDAVYINVGKMLKFYKSRGADYSKYIIGPECINIPQKPCNKKDRNMRSTRRASYELARSMIQRYASSRAENTYLLDIINKMESN